MSSGRVLVETVRIPADGVRLTGDLATPKAALGTVVFAHGSGSSRLSPRNRHVAEVLQSAGLATLLVDLLTPDEEAEDAITRRLRFDIPLLVGRLVDVVEWTRSRSPDALPIGLFGASTGAAAALAVAALRPETVDVVVSRGGRPDLVADLLSEVRAPTLLIVGGDDAPVIHLNELARDRLRCHREIRIVPGATHLFEEPGAIDAVAVLAQNWFLGHLGPRATPPKEA